jgi:hypothetical protein
MKVRHALPVVVSLLAGCHPHHVLAPTPPPELDRRVEDQARTATPDGQKLGEVFRGSAQADAEFSDWTILLDAQHCYFFSGVGEQTVERFALYVWNPGGHRVADKKSGTSSALLNYCPTENGVFKLQGKATRGFGHFAVGAYRTDAAPQPGAPPPPPPPADIAQMISAQAGSAAVGAVQVGNLFEGNGDKSEWSVALDPANCYWFIGAGEPGRVKELYLYLWDPQNKRVTESRSVSNTVMVGHCPTQPGMFKFQAKLDSGRGVYKVGVFQKPR